MPTYVVKQGDHISGLAERFGFRDYRTIWNDPRNAELRKKRKDPHVLHPGDTVFIPDKKSKHVEVSTGASHRFALAGQPLKLRLVLKDFDGHPIANTPCELDIDGVVHKVTSNDRGLIEKEIQRTAQGGHLRIPSLDLEYEVKIGHLDPVENDSGWRARLVNLGYYADPANEHDQSQLRAAIEEFQCDHNLKVTGELDAATRSALAQLHGL